MLAVKCGRGWSGKCVVWAGTLTDNLQKWSWQISGLVVKSFVMLSVLEDCDVVGEGKFGVMIDCMGADFLCWLSVSAFGVAVVGDVVLVQAE